MRVTVKLISALLFFFILIVIASETFRVHREVEFFDAKMRRDGLVIGTSLRAVALDAWRLAGPSRVERMVDDANRANPEIGVRWVWLDAPSGAADAPLGEAASDAELRAGHPASFIHRVRDNEGRFLTYIPVAVDSPRPAAIEISESLAPRDRYLAMTIRHAAVSAGVRVLVAVLVGAALGLRLVGLPLRRLTEKARRVGTGDLSGPLLVRGSDELAVLSGAMNQMCEELGEAQERVRAETAARIAALEQLRHADRLRIIGQMASGIAHELGTPLNVVSGRAGLIASGELPPPEVHESARIIRAQCDRMTAIVRRFLEVARRRSPQREPTDLGRIARQVVELLTPLSRKRGASLSVLVDAPELPARVDPGQVQQIAMNLVVNALQAASPGGKVEVRAFHERTTPPPGFKAGPGEYQCLSVSDDGPGIPSEDLGHIFEPFFTTKDVGEGTGLGLSIAEGLARDHGGWISVASEPGRGARFVLYLPAEDST
jgi:two-component system NtrC family sensor kinase